jgi:imidazole glycerol-phosphate synthase subunit HisH
VNVVLVDSGGANTGSVRYALQRLGVDAPVSGDPAEIAAADRVILPGVGAAAPAMARLQELGLVPVLGSLRQPVLGICLGMQLLFERSEEGGVDGLALLPGTVRRMPGTHTARVPHIGWNRLRRRVADPLLDGIDDGAHAYFVHGYAAPVDGHCVASCTHGGEFAAVVRRGNVAGAQFHPERSAAAGARLLANFLQGCP